MRRDQLEKGLNWTYPHFNVSNLLFLIPLLVKTVNFSQVLSVAMWPCVTPALFFFFLVSMSFVKSVAFCCHHVAGHGRILLLTLPMSFSLSLPGAQARNHTGEVTSSGLTQSLSWSVFRVQILPAVGSCLSPTSSFLRSHVCTVQL